MDRYYSGHKVKPGENLTTIAKLYGWTSPEALIQFSRNSGIVNPNVISPGQEIFIPYTKEKLKLWESHYEGVRSDAQNTMSEYHSTESNIYRAIRKSFDDVEAWWSALGTAKTAFNFVKLMEKLTNLRNVTKQLAISLQAMRAIKLSQAYMGTILDLLVTFEKELDRVIAALSENPGSTREKKDQLIKDGKMILRHAGMIMDIYSAVSSSRAMNHKPSDMMALGAGDTTDIAVFNAVKNVAGKTADQTFLVGKLGLYFGDLFAACSDKAEMELFIYGFEEYDKDVGKELEKHMLAMVEAAQLQLSYIRMQMALPIYSKYA